jgi:hypothetical protein
MTDADEIRADIVATRAELVETADAIATRLRQRGQLGLKIAAAVTGTAVLVLIVQRVRS